MGGLAAQQESFAAQEAAASPAHHVHPILTSSKILGSGKERTSNVGKSRELVLSSTPWGERGGRGGHGDVGYKVCFFQTESNVGKAGELVVFAEQTLPGGERQRQSV